ncbi:MAG: hypothetical protein HY077_01490 [Elusimicrobia bacterium]|nr:hypothetical protein [Elusimicrobiota bacterium]
MPSKPVKGPGQQPGKDGSAPKRPLPIVAAPTKPTTPVQPGKPLPNQPGKPAPVTTPIVPKKGERVMPVAPRPVAKDVLIDASKHGTIGAIKVPVRDAQGQALNHRLLVNADNRVIAPTVNNITVINNNTVINNITNIQNNWNSRDHGYGWHSYWDSGREYRYVHHYDDYGYHWYGWYIGEHYFWTRYDRDRYWWYDRYWNRWCYLHENRWWYQNPYDNVVYLYTDNGYYHYYDSGSSVVLVPDPTPAVEQPPVVAAPVEQETKTFYSLDGTRAVSISGTDASAYLQDTASEPIFEPFVLAKNVTSVEFPQLADGTIKIVLRLKVWRLIGGRWILINGHKDFDGDGNPWGAAPPPQPAAASFAPTLDSSIGTSAALRSLSALDAGNLNW